LAARISFVLFLLFTAVAPVAGAVELNSADARQAVSEFIASVDSYEAAFSQELRTDSGAVVEAESGHLWLQRPGRFRWEYRKPAERLIVANPEKIWLYDADLEQVTVRNVDAALLQSPAALLVGGPDALDSYEISGERDESGQTAVTLLPLASRGDFRSVVLYFTAGELTGIDLHDSFHQQTVIRFSDVVRNPAIDAARFRFEPPEGADVIDQTATPTDGA